MPGFLLDISPDLEDNIFPGKLRFHFIYPWFLRKFKIIEFSENFVSFLNKYVEFFFGISRAGYRGYISLPLS